MNRAEFSLEYVNKKIPATPEILAVEKEVIETIKAVDNRIIIDEPTIYLIDAPAEKLNEVRVRGFYDHLDGFIYVTNLYSSTSLTLFHDLLHETLHYLHSYKKDQELKFNIVFEEALNEFFTVWILYNSKKHDYIYLNKENEKEFLNLLSNNDYTNNVYILMKYLDKFSIDFSEAFYEYSKANLKYFLDFIPKEYFETNIDFSKK